MGESALRKPQPGYTECCKTYLRIYRNAVLESGKNAGDQGESSASVELISDWGKESEVHELYNKRSA